MLCRLISFFLLAFFFGNDAIADPAPDYSQLLHWRNIGPFRGGRTRAISGVPSQPNVFYFAQVNGGVFRTDDFGRTWEPLFDEQPTASVGALAVSVSDPNIIYVGSGEGLHRPDLSVGNGLYKSTDAGKTWTHLGLRDGQQIAQIAVDPRNPDHLLVAVAGHPYGPNEERGIFLSTDGGRTFQKTLYKDENTGGNDVQIDPQNPQIVYASLWEAREGPWENAEWRGANGGIFKSSDGGKTWKQLSGGLPDDITQANLAIAPSASRQLFAAVATPKNCTTLSVRRRGRKLEAWRQATSARSAVSAAAICRSCGSIRRIRTWFIPRASFAGNRLTAARPGTAGAGRRAATIIKTSGSILTTPRSSCSEAIRARSSL